jgi:hypothetical protein
MVVAALFVGQMVGASLASASAHLPSVANSAPCITSYGIHYYGVTSWCGTNQGALAEIETVHLYSSYGNHISNELWDIDTTHDCSGYGISWMESGEAVEYQQTGNWYFYALCPPGGSFTSNFLQQPPSSEVYQFPTYVIAHSGYQQYTITEDHPNGSTNWSYTFGGMGSFTPSEIEIGLETTANDYNDAHSDTAYFEYNEYYSTNGNWYFQPVTGVIFDNKPPYFAWYQAPNGSGNHGGTAYTTCC